MNTCLHLVNYDLGRKAYQRADEQVPFRWYEYKYLPYIVVIILMFPLYVVTLSRYWFSPPVWLSIIGVVFSVCGWWYDTITTHQSMKLRPEFNKRGIYYPAYEMNPMTRETPHLILQIASPSTLLAIVDLPIIWFFLPGLGVAVGIGHVLAGIGNYRNAQRLRLNLQIFDTMADSKGAHEENGRETHSSEMLAGPFQLGVSN